MIDSFYMFSDLNRDGSTFPLETVYENWSGSSTKIISMTDDEDAYLFSMQLMLGPMNIIPFRKFHDGYWCDRNYKRQPLQDYLRGFIFCTHPNLLGFMMSFQGDLQWDKEHKKKTHWSQASNQGRLGGPFMI